MNTTQLNIGGRIITVRSTSNDEHLKQVSAELNERIKSTQQVIPDSHEALLFVALALTDELMNTQEKLYHIQDSSEEKIHKMLSILENLEPITTSS